ncbi:MAG: hypothetical protein AAF487_05360, partial [Bacteroidota bacterium]
SKILIPNFKWQYLYDDNNRNLQDHNNVAEMIIKKQQPTMHKSNGSKSKNSKDNNNKNTSWWKKLWS